MCEQLDISECLAVQTMKDPLLSIFFELWLNDEIDKSAVHRDVLGVDRRERVGMDGSPSLQAAGFDELNWDSFCMNHLVLLMVLCCVALLPVDPRSCHDHTGWVAGLIAFDRAVHCVIAKDVVDAEFVCVFDSVDNYWAV